MVKKDSESDDYYEGVKKFDCSFADFDAYMNDLDMEIESRFGPIGLCWILRASYSPLVNGGSSRYQQQTLSPGHSGCASASAVATPKSRLKTSTASRDSLW